MEIKGIITAVSGPREFEGKLQVGFMIRDKWYNVEGEKEGLEEIKKISLVKGNEVTFEIIDGAPKNLKVIKKAQKEEDSNIVKISGKDYMTYEGLLKKAHEKDPCFFMEITESWVSEDMKMAWCKVRLTSNAREYRQFFDGFGSSTPENTGSMTKEHPVEMAHTRAKGRALRDYLNIGQVMAEELKQN